MLIFTFYFRYFWTPLLRRSVFQVILMILTSSSNRDLRDRRSRFSLCPIFNIVRTIIFPPLSNQRSLFLKGPWSIVFLKEYTLKDIYYLLRKLSGKVVYVYTKSIVTEDVTEGYFLPRYCNFTLSLFPVKHSHDQK